MDKISLIIPCYNEEETIPFLNEELIKLKKSISKVDFEVILVDNCSSDNTLKLMKELNKKYNYDYISFSRNFGKDASMYAGLKYSSGDYVAIMDADLQDPPELIAEMYYTLKKENYDCVATYRKNRKHEPLIRSFLANIFYKLINNVSDYKIPKGARDFRLMTRQMVNAILQLDENERFTKGIFSWVGFKTKWISFDNHERIAGKTKLPMKSAFSYAIKGITSFTTFPLKISSIMGGILCFIATIYLIYIIVNYFTLNTISGYTSVICVLLYGFGFLLLVLGIIGQYIAGIYLEIKNRPKYIVKESSLK